MATRKKSAVDAHKVRATAAVTGRAPRRTAPPSGDDSGRLLREAAWSRMFGRVEAKNPFAR